MCHTWCMAYEEFVKCCTDKHKTVAGLSYVWREQGVRKTNMHEMNDFVPDLLFSMC